MGDEKKTKELRIGSVHGEHKSTNSLGNTRRNSGDGSLEGVASAFSAAGKAKGSGKGKDRDPSAMRRPRRERRKHRRSVAWAGAVIESQSEAADTAPAMSDVSGVGSGAEAGVGSASDGHAEQESES